MRSLPRRPHRHRRRLGVGALPRRPPPRPCPGIGPIGVNVQRHRAPGAAQSLTQIFDHGRVEAHVHRCDDHVGGSPGTGAGSALISHQ
jgi:hypothetical protein